tara:strand:- start:87 stop:1316 length:1230 start_codon:yes stop_codon:yes gene_type:complete
MMKNFLIIIIISSLTAYNSYISFYGSGQKYYNLNPSNITLGWSNLFDSNSDYNNGSLSNFYVSKLVRLSIASNFNFNSVGGNDYYNQSLNYFNFLFPIRMGKQSMSISLSPFYRINSHIIESEFNYLAGDYNHSVYAYKSEYNFSGGPSNVAISFSSIGPKIGESLKSSFGVKLNYIFGSLYSYMQHKVYDVIYEDDGSMNYTLNSHDYYTTINNYNGYGVEAEFSLMYQNQTISSSFNTVNNISIEQYFYDDIIPESLELGIDPIEEKSFSLSSPFEFNIGYKYIFNNKHYFIAEYYSYTPYESESEFNVFNNSDVNKNKFNIAYYRPLLNDKLRFSMGLYNILSENELLNSNRIGSTIGLGINMIKNLDIEFCLDIGENKIQISSENLSERYINLHLGLTSSDMWFK